MEKNKTNRTYKSRFFEMIFSEKKELSTYNPNLPLRFLLYVGDILSNMTRRMNLYGRRMIPLPIPQFLVFYNGKEERPDREVMLLSSAFQVPDEDISLELKVVVLNIRKGHNTQLLEACRTLQDYAEYTSRVRKYAEQMEIADAVERAVTECIKEGILSEFLSKNRAEAVKVSIYEYDQEEHMRMEREEVRQDMIRYAIENGATEEQLKNLLGVTEDELETVRKQA